MKYDSDHLKARLFQDLTAFKREDGTHPRYKYKQRRTVSNLLYYQAQAILMLVVSNTSDFLLLLYQIQATRVAM